MDIQIVSDLHLEFRPAGDYRFLVYNGANILLLCGDVCACGTAEDYSKFEQFIRHVMTMNYTHVFHVSGNHEYYSSPAVSKNNTIQKINERLTQLSKKCPKYYYLNNKAFKLKTPTGVIYIGGTTMWSKVYGGNPAAVETIMNDYNCIYIDDAKGVRKLTAGDMLKMHKKAETFLQATLAMAKKSGTRCIFMTHHKPYITDMGAPHMGYETDMTFLMGPPLILWAHGHEHKHAMKIIKWTHVIANPLGYPYQHGVNFDPYMSIVID